MNTTPARGFTPLIIVIALALLAAGGGYLYLARTGAVPGLGLWGTSVSSSVGALSFQITSPKPNETASLPVRLIGSIPRTWLLTDSPSSKPYFLLELKQGGNEIIDTVVYVKTDTGNEVNPRVSFDELLPDGGIDGSQDICSGPVTLTVSSADKNPEHSYSFDFTCDPALPSTISPDNAESRTVLTKNNRYTLTLLTYGQHPSYGRLVATNNATGKETSLEGSVEIPLEGVSFILNSADYVGLSNDPDGKYIMIDSGTSAQRGKTIYSLESGRHITGFCTAGGPVFWKDFVVYKTCNDLTPENWGVEVQPQDVVALNLKTLASTTIAAAHPSSGVWNFYGQLEVKGDTLTYDIYPLIQRNGYTIPDESASAVRTFNLLAL